MTNADSYSLKGIHLPEDLDLILRIKGLARVISLVVAMFSVLVVAGWMTGIRYLKIMFVGPSVMPIEVAVSLLLIAIPLMFRLTNKTPKGLQVIYKSVTIVFGIVVGVGNLLHFSILNVSLSLLGWALVLTRTKIPFRFKLMQLVAFGIVMLGLCAVMVNVYRYLASGLGTGIFDVPMNVGVLFALLGEALLLRWPNRGFMGLFNTESLTSVVAFRTLVLNMILTPVVGGIGLAVARRMSLAVFETVAAVVTIQMVVFAMLMWFGVKRLYEWELERLIAKEEARVRDLGLSLSNEDMKVKVAGLEETKERYLKNLRQMNGVWNLEEYFE